MANEPLTNIPIRAVEQPIICKPYDAPNLHWHYDRVTGEASKLAGRRPSRYWYKLKSDVVGQGRLELSEGQDDLVMVNNLRVDVARWREGGYAGATATTKKLLHYWRSHNRARRFFFCQIEAVETVIYLAEIVRAGKGSAAKRLFTTADLKSLVDAPADPNLLPLTRFGCKMATGSGKTVVMSMLVAWAFCNRGESLGAAGFPSAVLVCCPNLTVKERLQVLRPENEGNYYAAFDIVPTSMFTRLANGKVIVENWHSFAPASEHDESGRSYAVVHKGAETAEAFAKRVLGDLYERLPILDHRG